MGSYVNYFPVERWVIIEESEKCVNVKVGEICDMGIDDVTRWINKKDYELIQNGTATIKFNFNSIEWFCKGRQGYV